MTGLLLPAADQNPDQNRVSSENSNTKKGARRRPFYPILSQNQAQNPMFFRRLRVGTALEDVDF